MATKPSTLRSEDRGGLCWMDTGREIIRKNGVCWKLKNVEFQLPLETHLLLP